MKTEPTDFIYPQQNRVQALRPDNNSYADQITFPVLEGGLTKREYFAGLAMQGLLANQYVGGNGQPVLNIAIDAVEYADALIEALNRTES